MTLQAWVGHCSGDNSPRGYGARDRKAQMSSTILEYFALCLSFLMLDRPEYLLVTFCLC